MQNRLNGGYTKAMRTLAIDPGYGRCGVAIIEKLAGKKEVLVYSDCIETAKGDPFPDRLGAVITACKNLIDIYSPDSLAIEKLYFSNNQKTAMQVAEVRGALIGLASLCDIPVSEYTPGEIKSATTGYGGADKKQIAKMLHLLIVINKVIRFDDEYDAIAVGITHMVRAR